MSHMILHAIVHGLIYRALWSLTRGMHSGSIVALAVVGIGAIAFFHFLFRRKRHRRRW